MGCGPSSPRVADEPPTIELKVAQSSDASVPFEQIIALEQPPPRIAAAASALAVPAAEVTRALASNDDDDWDADDDDDGSAPRETASYLPEPSTFAAVALGNTLSLSGESGAGELNATLRCKSCGTGTVWRFPRARWDDTIDYYHCRNFAPDSRMPERTQADLAKLCARLLPDESAAAYACGCSWQTVTEPKPLAAFGTPAAPHGGARLEGEDVDLLRWVLDG